MTSPQILLLSLQTEFAQNLGFDPDIGITVEGRVETPAEEPIEMDRASLEELLDGMRTKQRRSMQYQEMYCVAHELRRLSEEFYDEARQIEDTDEAIMDRFQVNGGLL